MNFETLKSARARCLVQLNAFCLASAAQAQSTPSTAPFARIAQGHMQQDAAWSFDMKKSMVAGMDSLQTIHMSDDTDKDFVMMMEMHHQQGVEMAKMELAQGKSPTTKAMARQIIAAQKKIAQLDQWLVRKKMSVRPV